MVHRTLELTCQEEQKHQARDQDGGQDIHGCRPPIIAQVYDLKIEGEVDEEFIEQTNNLHEECRTRSVFLSNSP